jgi:hypothetical protein
VLTEIVVVDVATTVLAEFRSSTLPEVLTVTRYACTVAPRIRKIAVVTATEAILNTTRAYGWATAVPIDVDQVTDADTTEAPVENDADTEPRIGDDVVNVPVALAPMVTTSKKFPDEPPVLPPTAWVRVTPLEPPSSVLASVTAIGHPA